MQITCPRCGSIYELRKVKSPVRDKDSIICDVCDQILESWNGGVMYFSTLIKKNENYKKHPNSESDK